MRHAAMILVLSACYTGGGPTTTTAPAAPAQRPAPAPTPSSRAAAERSSSARPVSHPDHDCSKQLTAPAAKGDLVAVEDLLRTEACNGNAFDGMHWSLVEAASRDHVEVVRALIAAGADLEQGYTHPANSTFADDGTALWFAVERAHPAVVAELLHAGANPNRTSPRKLPVLLLAAQQETPGIAKLLVEGGASRTQSGRMGETAMTWGGGPSAQVFVYFEGIGMPTDQLPADVRDSLHWEASHLPAATAPADERAQFFADVAVRSKARRSRELAITHLSELADQTSIVVPALIAIAMGPSVDSYDWAPTEAATALEKFAWTPEHAKVQAKLLELLAKDRRQQLRLHLLNVFARQAPVTAPIVTALVAALDQGRDRPNAATALGELLVRATAKEAALVRGAKPSLERAAKLTVKSPCDGVDECEVMQTAQNARKALDKLGQ